MTRGEANTLRPNMPSKYCSECKVYVSHYHFRMVEEAKLRKLVLFMIRVTLLASAARPVVRCTAALSVAGSIPNKYDTNVRSG